jgi:hypothetical protein
MNGFTLPIALVGALLCQTAGVVWWASGINTEVNKLIQNDIQFQYNKEEYIQRLSVIETKVEGNYRILIKLEEEIEK